MSPPLSASARAWLLSQARASIEHGLQSGSVLAMSSDGLPSELCRVAATFVTLKIDRRLRGCIGRLEASRPLAADVVANAFGAAFQDPRFERLTAEELENVSISISVLSSPEILEIGTEAELLSIIRPGVDGLILREGEARATFLPAVWDSLPKPRDFVAELKKKMGRPREGWSERMQAFRYSVEAFGEDGSA